MEFYIVYIQEAHPSDAWQTSSNLEDQVVYADPASLAARSSVAGVCLLKLDLQLPALLDDMGNSTERAYTGWPDRLYLIDRDGRVAFKSAPGPYGFKPDDLEQALKKIVSPIT